MKRKLKALVASVLLATSMSSHAYGCPPFDEVSVVAYITKTETLLKVLWNAVMSNVSSILMSYDMQEIAAMKVVTAQIATGAKAEINADVSIAHGEITAIAHLETVKHQMKVYQDFSPQTGQGVDPCGQLLAQANLAVTSRQAGDMAGDAISRVAAAPGRYGSPENFVTAMLKARQAMFATEDEAKLGFGAAQKAEVQVATGGKFSLAGADTNARVLFADTADPRVRAAREMYLNHMAGAPDLPIGADAAGLPGGREYLLMKHRKDATMSAALNSLATVGAENTPNDNGKSKMQAVRDVVGQYYGGAAQERWKGWTGQSERGLMADQMKMDASLLAVKANQYESGQRLEVLLGSMLALQAQKEYGSNLVEFNRQLNGLQRPGVR